MMVTLASMDKVIAGIFVALFEKEAPINVIFAQEVMLCWVEFSRLVYRHIDK